MLHAIVHMTGPAPCRTAENAQQVLVWIISPECYFVIAETYFKS